MDFEYFRLVLRSISRPSTKGFRIVHALNITRSSENHEELVSDTASCGHGNSTETCTHEITKMFIYSIISFVSGFFFDVSAARLISVFSLWSFRFVVFLCRRDCFDVTNEITFYDRSCPKADKDGVYNWPQHRLKYGRGSERLAAHTQ